MADDDSSSKAVVLKVFGADLGERLALAAGHGKRKNYRGVLEPTDAVTQCERAGVPFVANMKCYLCDQPIPAKELLSGPEDELYPECEHIFSVTEARWYLDIYMARRPPGDPWTLQAVRLEYAQAHRVCNQAKSNYNFFTGDAGGTPVLNMVGIRKILLNIQTRARKNIAKYATQPELQRIMTDIATNVTGQATAIADRVRGIITHIQAQANAIGGHEVYQAMMILSRASLLADPSTLPPALKAIHDEWYANAPAALAKAEALFQDFMAQTYIRYPQLQPTQLYGLLFAGLPPITQDLQIPQSAVMEILSAYFKRVPSDESSEKLLLSSVYSALYIRILTMLLNQPVSEATLDTICALSTRLAVVVENEPKVPTIVGYPPALRKELRDQCEILEKNRGRAYRTEARDLNAASMEGVDNPPTADDDATYFLGDLAPQLSTYLQQAYGMEASKATDAASWTAEEAREAFIAAYPEGIDRAKEAAANVASALINFIAGENRAAAEDLSHRVYTFILNSRISETVTYRGGLRIRRALYGNARTPSARHGLYARLRKRTRSRTTARVRQRSSHPRTWRQRKHLDRL